MKREEFEKYQKVAYKMLVNAKRDNKLSQAFLLSGETGSPVFGAAIFLAKLLVCESDSVCDNCLDCIKIDEKTYADLIIVDGSQYSIKKEHIETIPERFSKSSIEDRGIKIYIINMMENSGSRNVFNMLLKFIEEPPENTYAIITTNNINAIPSTIVSRCQNIRISNTLREQLYDELVADGYNEEDAAILSKCYSSRFDIEEVYGDNYNSLKDCFIDLMKAYLNDEQELNYYYQRECEEELKNNNENAKMFLKFFELFVKDTFIDNETFKEHQELVTKFKELKENRENILKYIIEAGDNINHNANMGLAINKLLFQIEQER